MLKALMRMRLEATKHWLTSSIRSAGRQGSGSRGKAIFMALILLYVAGSFGFLIYGFFSQLSLPYYNAGLGWLYFTFFALADFALIFVGSIFSVKSSIFEPKDNELLFSLPVPPSMILASRMFTMIALNYVFGLITTVPALLAWLRFCPLAPGGLIAFVLLAIFIPLLSLAISSLFAWFISMATRRVRRKSLMTTVFSLIFLAVYFIAFSRANTAIARLAANGGSIAESLSAAAPLWWIGNAVSQGDPVYLVYASALCIIPFVIVWVILSRTITKSVTTKKGSAKIVYVERESKETSSFSALYRREMKRFFSSSAYVLNAGLGAIFLVAAGVALVIRREVVLEIVKTIPGVESYLMPVFIGGLCVISGITMISAPSVSMEGKSIWIVRSLPVTTRDILNSKLLVHVSIACPASAVGGIGAAIASDTSFAGAALCVLIPAVYTVLTALVGLAANLRHTNLDWISEMQAVKNSMSVIITMGAMLFTAAACGGIFYGLTCLGLPVLSCLLILLIVIAVICRFLYTWIMGRGAALFESLKV